MSGGHVRSNARDVSRPRALSSTILPGTNLSRAHSPRVTVRDENHSNALHTNSNRLNHPLLFHLKGAATLNLVVSHQISKHLNRLSASRLLLFLRISQYTLLASVTMMVLIQLLFHPHRTLRYALRRLKTQCTGTHLRQRLSVHHHQTQLVRKKHESEQ